MWQIDCRKLEFELVWNPVLAFHHQAEDATPLMIAAYWGHSAVIPLLIEHGAAVDWQVRACCA